MRLVVITGLSGAGKTFALHSFEDAGYYAVDNLPPRLLPSLAEYCREAGHGKAAVVVDARAGVAFRQLPVVLQEMQRSGDTTELLFLDATDEILIRRYKETRRPHPLLTEQTEGGIQGAIHAERTIMQIARALADRVLDTSTLTVSQLREVIHVAYAGEPRPGMLITITSFGFKHGVPGDADLVFDVRFLVNPHYVPELRSRDGRDPEVATYVHADPRTRAFQDRMTDLIRFALPQYQQEGKAYVNIAIGCTGGKHRSVVLAEDLATLLRQERYRVVVLHRDVERERAQADAELGREAEEDTLALRAGSEWAPDAMEAS
ncbi:MAG: RNase adapter RapZ [Chloroherpetonaceae bacterium]|nr:RNase adapter RapZ [Chthonomonadaceae bacterium]MDW8207859.1 RNase adapter RapZ [Chloroherpetonaceae bacterium]